MTDWTILGASVRDCLVLIVTGMAAGFLLYQVWGRRRSQPATTDGQLSDDDWYAQQ